MAIFELSTVGLRAVASRFDGYDRLTVRQRRKWREILLSLELKNTYEVFDDGGQPVLRVAETGDGLVAWLRRLLLGPLRPMTVAVTDIETGETILTLRRPFRWILHRLEVSSGDGTPLGAIQREWSWFQRHYRLEDADGYPAIRLFGPFFRPWTFEIQRDGITLGLIQKRWSGMGKEIFSDADNFGVDLSQVADPYLKALCFAATVLVDVVHFERSKS